ncbi:MAG: carbamoyl-phosphate synthase small subunit [Spartobacteria bacterium]|nr:carbamoyl-phosphate synthase small subunit [Spartobacteria bacterium]
MTTKWNWREQRENKAFLALEDGTILRGYSAGAPCDALGEVVFNTGLTGYQEILSDPSYSGQFVTMTYPEIGNTGLNDDDMESRQLFANGFLIHQNNQASNWRSKDELSTRLIAANIPCLAGIDARALTIRLRDKGTMKGFICVSGTVSEDAAVQQARDWAGLDGKDYASKVSCTASYAWDVTGEKTCTWGITDVLPKADLNIVAYDFGIKWNILRGLRRSGMNVTVVPAKTSAAEVMALNPQGVFLSNGPADPAAVTYAADNIRALIGQVPMMGICLGHQLLGIALGGRTHRLKFGHHGCNHPVKDLLTSKIEITSQNHNFTLDADSLNPAEVEVTHINLNDQTVEGIRHRSEPLFSVQYHPEACPGPHDPYYLFGRFRDMILKA